jgi:hypothetical protein
MSNNWVCVDVSGQILKNELAAAIVRLAAHEKFDPRDTNRVAETTAAQQGTE